MAENRTPLSSSSSSSTATAANIVCRDESPDSVILTFESNFSSLFSSASASGDRCSFASDAQDRDCFSSEVLSQHLVGNSGGPDLSHSDSNKSAISVCTNNARFHSKKVDKVKANKEGNNTLVLHHHADHEIEPLDSARSSFSQALKECQERRSRSEAVNKKSERRRPASLDLNNSSATNVVVSSSPKSAVMKKVSTTARKSGNFPSPGTPNYRYSSVGMNKGWSSERVPLPSNGSNRRPVGASLLPLSNNNRGLPSKWEDAERWIFSPVSGDGVGRVSSSSMSCQQPLRRPKSKSGPLGPPGFAYYSMYSPVMPMYEDNQLSSHMAGSPFSAGGMLADGWSFRVNGESRSFSNEMEPCIARSASVHGCTDLACHASQASSHDERANDVKDAATVVSRAVSKRDMATQMSPEGSCHSSPRRSSFSPATPSILPIVEVQGFSSSKPEVRDVQIDERVTVTRWSKKYRGCNPGKVSEDVDEWKLKAVEPHSAAWEVSDTVKSLSKARRDEAKISAWENLQKAKAEAAIRKLEMKLEKKRSSSVDKIMKKLRSAQKKAQEMRSAILANQTLQELVAELGGRHAMPSRNLDYFVRILSKSGFDQ